MDRPVGPAHSEGGWFVRRFYRASTILRVEEPAEGYHVITLGGERLKNVAWEPGQKIQIAVGGGSNRTYTPFRWDPARGEAPILAYLHRDGPGSLWAARAQVGDPCLVYGPRRSLELSGLGKRPFLFGDETSMGLAAALGTTMDPRGEVACVFEVSSTAASPPAWRTIGTGDAVFVPRRDADAHLDEIESQTRRILDSGPPTGFVLSGKVSSIQRVQRLLKSRGISTSRMRVKAYWATGKEGLD
ncbi:MAG: siderophore-interacting protein [Thermoplasmata archaeon]